MNVEEKVLGPSLVLIKGQGINFILDIKWGTKIIQLKQKREKERNDICKERFDLEEAI